MSKVIRMLLLVAVSISLLHCGGPTPEERVRRIVDAAVDAAESRDVVAFRDLVSERYSDDAGRDRAGIGGVVGLYMRQRPSIHVWTRIRGIRRDGTDAADATLHVVLAAGPLTDLSRLDEIEADLLRVEFRAEADPDGRWRITRADWRSAGLTEILAP
ncbi:MAG: hypothetical protein GY716_20770 [bacterium]|nr:hypothetical protein [bacterium]